jgi:DNA ligase (NAD+)
MASVEELNNINDIGPILAQSVYSYFKDENNLREIEELKSLGVNTTYHGVQEQLHEAITNKKFVITGTLEAYTRDEIKEILEAHGGKASESVSKKTDALILGENPGSKYDKAVELGIPIWTEKTLKTMSDIFTKYNS